MPFQMRLCFLERFKRAYHEFVVVRLLDELVPWAKVLVDELDELVLEERHRECLDEIDKSLDLRRVGV